jgi:arsenate reductase (thioredoxin)
MKLRILFLCTHNACRSQMAEALLRHRYGGTYEAFSAGTNPSQVHPCAVQVLQEMGVDTSSLISESLSVYVDQPFDAVITTCDGAQRSCPVFPGALRTLHHAFEDPSCVEGSQEEILDAFRRTRDRIDVWIEATFHPRSFV